MDRPVEHRERRRRHVRLTARDPRPDLRGLGLIVTLAVAAPLSCLAMSVPPTSAPATALVALTAITAGLLTWRTRRELAVDLLVASRHAPAKIGKVDRRTG
jgi:hypothetical protein